MTNVGTSQVSTTDNSADHVMTRLEAIHQQIAALKVRCEAAAEVGETSSPDPNVKMVPIFNLGNRPLDSLCSDGDVKRRSAQIIKTLSERGAQRLLGSMASPSLADAIAGLYDSHPNFTLAVDHVLGEEILARQCGGALAGLRLLLHGGAGVGKSDYALTLAKLLGVPCEVISLSSAQAAAYLGGSEEYWSNSQPGIVWKRLVQGTHANPIIILDEIDKVSNNWGDPLGALYQMLEPKTAVIFRDKSVPWLPIDTRYCSWVATANNVEAIHPAIRSRFTEIEVTSPTEDALANLVQRLYSSLLEEFSLSDRLAKELTDVQTKALIGGSVRDAKRILRSAIGLALRLNKCEITVEAVVLRAPRQRIGFF